MRVTLFGSSLGVERSWGYIRKHDYQTPDSIVDNLVDIVSKNGCLLLNIAPRTDGTISAKSVRPENLYAVETKARRALAEGNG